MGRNERDGSAAFACFAAAAPSSLQQFTPVPHANALTFLLPPSSQDASRHGVQHLVL